MHVGQVLIHFVASSASSWLLHQILFHPSFGGSFCTLPKGSLSSISILKGRLHAPCPSLCYPDTSVATPLAGSPPVVSHYLINVLIGLESTLAQPPVPLLLVYVEREEKDGGPWHTGQLLTQTRDGLLLAGSVQTYKERRVLFHHGRS